MKINSNHIGNYGPAYTNNIKPKVKAEDITKLKQTIEVKQNNTVQSSKQLNTISNDEKDYFVNLYPENKKEILDYHYYQRSGKMSGVSVGSLFDKKG